LVSWGLNEQVHDVTCGPTGGSQFDATSHGIVNFEPSYVTRIESTSTYGTNVLWVTPTNIWLLGASGNPVLSPGQPLSSFARSIIGALGPSPGALAAISLAVPGTRRLPRRGASPAPWWLCSETPTTFSSSSSPTHDTDERAARAPRAPCRSAAKP
jgi:hypothetical protein